MSELAKKAPSDSTLPYTVEDKYYCHFPETVTINTRTFEKGWYFLTEVDDLNGPYPTKLTCKFMMQFYGACLDTGILYKYEQPLRLYFWSKDKTVGCFRDALLSVGFRKDHSYKGHKPSADYIFCSEPLEPRTFYCFEATEEELELAEKCVINMGDCKRGFLPYFQNKVPVGYFVCEDLFER